MGHKDYYDERKQCCKVTLGEDEDELVIYNRHGRLVKLKPSI
jgi:hypothetical protein